MDESNHTQTAPALAQGHPEWFDYIRVQKRTIIGSTLPLDYVISFGLLNILTPKPTEEKAERELARVKDWLWMWIQKDAAELLRLHTLRPADEWHEDFGTVLWWHVPIQEPPYVGAGPGMGECYTDGEPTVCARLLEQGWLTHWSPIPSNPEVR
jgi:hypothetical protein